MATVSDKTEWGVGGGGGPDRSCVQSAIDFPTGPSCTNSCPRVLATVLAPGVSRPTAQLPAGATRCTNSTLIRFCAWLHKPTKEENVNDSGRYSSWGSHEIFNISRPRTNPPGKIQSIFMLH